MSREERLLKHLDTAFKGRVANQTEALSLLDRVVKQAIPVIAEHYRKQSVDFFEAITHIGEIVKP
jgi:hypothetical protein